MLPSKICTTAIWLLLLGFYSTSGVKISYVYREVCQGGQFNVSCILGTLYVASITITTTPDSQLAAVCTTGECSKQNITCPNTCSRVASGVDYGLDDDPLWLSRYIQSSCQNKVSCNPVMPLFWQITTSTKFERGQPTCILGQLKYFLSARVHLECRVGEEHEGYTGPPLTLPPTTPPTVAPTTPEGWAIHVLSPGLSDKEKIILGACLGAAIAVLILSLALCYSWDRHRRRQRENRLLAELGKPQSMDDIDGHLDDPNWKPDDIGKGNSDYQAEMSGVRPFEYLDMETLRKGTSIVDSNASVLSCQTDMSTLPSDYRGNHDDSAYTTLASHFQPDDYYNDQDSSSINHHTDDCEASSSIGLLY